MITVHCVLDRDKYSTKVFYDENHMRTRVEVSIDDDELYGDLEYEVEDVIVVLKEKEHI